MFVYGQSKWGKQMGFHSCRMAFNTVVMGAKHKAISQIHKRVLSNIDKVRALYIGMK